MIIRLLIFIIIGIWAERGQAQSQDTIYRFYKGAVNEKYSITVVLKQIGVVCQGYYYYDKYRKSIRVEGTAIESVLSLREIDQQGNKTTSVFVGNYNEDWSAITGAWENKTKDRRFVFDLQAIYPPLGKSTRYRFDDIRRFQELLNYFDLEPALPFRTKEGILTETKGFHWKNKEDKATFNDYQRFIPYRLAKRYIMNKVLLSPEGSFNYFQIKESAYKAHEMHYKSLCCVYRTNSCVGLLVQFQEDNGWDAYDVTFLLIYDYAGHLLDACKVGKRISIEQEGRQLSEEMSSSFKLDQTIETSSKGTLIEFGIDDNGIDYYKKTPSERQVYYILQPTGRFIRQEVLLEKTKK